MTYGSVVAIALCGSSVFADPPDKAQWEARNAWMEYEREGRTRGREELKHHGKLERKARKRHKKLAREARKYQQEMWRDGSYAVDEVVYESDFAEAPQPAYIEDQLYQIIKEVRDLAEAVGQ